MSGGFVGRQNYHATVSVYFTEAYVMSPICTPTTLNKTAVQTSFMA